MKKYLLQLFESSGGLTPQDIILRLLVAAAVGAVIYISYWLSHAGSNYSRKFNVTLVSLTVMTAMVMTVIGNNIAMSLGMVGALSIVRFRTAIKDSRDTAYIFWTIIVGICCGAGDYLVASVGSAVVFLVLLVLGRLRNDNRQVLIIRAGRAGERKIEARVCSHFERKALLRVKNTTEQSVEFIYELTRRTLEGAEKVHGPVTDALYALGGVEYVNVVSQNDEITG